MITLTQIVWCILSFGGLIGSQRMFRRELQGFLMALTRNPTISLTLYAVLFAPGVAVHEFSHWIIARLLGVRTISLSLIPTKVSRDQLRLGYVETERTDPIRSALIGVMPLLSGTLLLTLLTMNRLGLDPIVGASPEAGYPGVLQTLARIPNVPDVGLWLYLAVAISNTMLPSAADRSAWLIAGLIVAAIAAFMIWSGWGLRGVVWLSDVLSGIPTRLAAVFSLTAVLNLALAIILGVGGRAVLGLRRVFSD